MVRLKTIPLNDIERKLYYSNNWVAKQHSDNVIKHKANNMVRNVQKLRGISTVLDVGCGAGILVDKLNKLGYDATGLDSSQSAIDYARENCRGKFILGDESLDVINTRYDLIGVSHLLEHLIDSTRLFSGIKRVLIRPGYICVAVPNLGSYKANSIWRATTINKIHDYDHYYAYDAPKLTELLESNGFDIVSVTTRTYGHTIITGVIRTILHKLLRQPMKLDATPDNIYKSIAPAKLTNFYDTIFNNKFVSPLYEPFNRISERNNMGEELTAIAMLNNEERGNK
ncbi:class I SAM-dependent methyltransferase [Chloroflexota bacterium]